MGQSRFGEDTASTWEVELDRLCAGQSGLSLAQCLSTLYLLRALGPSSATSENALAKLLDCMGNTAAPDEMKARLSEIASAYPLSEANRIFLEARLEALPAELETWAFDCGLFKQEEPAGEEAPALSHVPLSEAACALVRFVESLPLDKACFDQVIRRCLAASGKLGGMFSTPESITRLIARLLEPELRVASSVYDPCCGAGFLLDACESMHLSKDEPLAVYAQDVDPQAYALMKSRSMISSALNQKAPSPREEANVMLGDVLTQSWHSAQAPFDVVVAHAPTLLEWPGSASKALSADERFAPAGVLAPKSAADLAFAMHAYHCTAQGGTTALIAYPAPLRRGEEERSIRRYLLEQNAVNAVIQLPPNLLSDSSMAVSILILRKDNAQDEVLFIDAMQEGKKTAEGMILAPETLERIARAFENRTEEDGFSRKVSRGTIAANGWSLTVADYFKGDSPKISVDLSHLKQVSNKLTDIPAIKREKLSGIFPW